MEPSLLFLNIFLGIVLIIIVAIVIKYSRDKNSTRSAKIGFVFFIAFLAVLFFGIIGYLLLLNFAARFY
jgi:uncharacterized membrane protein YozB (DUF420 family)